MASISYNSTVRVAAAQQTVVQIKPVSHLQEVIKPKEITENTQVTQVARPVNSIQTVIRAENVTAIREQPEIEKTRSDKTIVEPINTMSAITVSGGNVNIYV